jgi:hypothetical protein
MLQTVVTKGNVALDGIDFLSTSLTVLWWEQ